MSCTFLNRGPHDTTQDVPLFAVNKKSCKSRFTHYASSSLKSNSEVKILSVNKKKWINNPPSVARKAYRHTLNIFPNIPFAYLSLCLSNYLTLR